MTLDHEHEQQQQGGVFLLSRGPLKSHGSPAVIRDGGDVLSIHRTDSHSHSHSLLIVYLMVMLLLLIWYLILMLMLMLMLIEVVEEVVVVGLIESLSEERVPPIDQDASSRSSSVPL